jgi:integrase/recombinase XerD
LREALRGRVTKQHRFLLCLHLDQVDVLDAAVAKIDREVEASIAPFRTAVEQVSTVPGVKSLAAQTILSEIGIDMSRFPSSGHLISWACICPRNDESAGKRRSTRIRKGSPWLKTTLVQCAWAASGIPSASSVPTIEDMLSVWRAGRSIRDSSANKYLQWIRRFRVYCAEQNLHEAAELTLDGVYRFTTWYSRRRQRKLRELAGARSAVYALSRVYKVMGLGVPAWRVEKRPPPATTLLRAFADHLMRHRGNPEQTVKGKLDHIAKFLEYLALHGKSWRTMSLATIDAFLIETSQCYARATVAGIAASIRSFCRFLLTTGRISVELAESIVAPVQRKHERPRRALPWEDVQRLLRSVDTSTAQGLRDYAILLMMSIYGFGAGEVIRLQLQDIDWDAATVRVVRPKTGVAFTLPLLPAVAKALARYLRNGRPPNTTTRHVFVQIKIPFGPLSCSSAVRHVVVGHAKIAGIKAGYLGSHVLRHSNAARQVDLGTRPRVLSDILGHRDPESVSAYVRIATQSLRNVSLPVPT